MPELQLTLDLSVLPEYDEMSGMGSVCEKTENPVTRKVGLVVQLQMVKTVVLLML